MPIPHGVTVEKHALGDWRVCRSPKLAPPAGSISKASYPSQEDALKAARAGEYD